MLVNIRENFLEYTKKADKILIIVEWKYNYIHTKGRVDDARPRLNELKVTFRIY